MKVEEDQRWKIKLDGVGKGSEAEGRSECDVCPNLFAIGALLLSLSKLEVEFIR